MIARIVDHCSDECVALSCEYALWRTVMPRRRILRRAAVACAEGLWLLSAASRLSVKNAANDQYQHQNIASSPRDRTARTQRFARCPLACFLNDRRSPQTPRRNNDCVVESLTHENGRRRKGKNEKRESKEPLVCVDRTHRSGQHDQYRDEHYCLISHSVSHSVERLVFRLT